MYLKYQKNFVFLRVQVIPILCMHEVVYIEFFASVSGISLNLNIIEYWLL